MPRPRLPKLRRTRRRRVARRKLAIPKSPEAMARINRATITETCITQDGNGVQHLQANTPYLASTSIAQYPRARQVAACFKFYRLKKVIYEYTPDYNVYQAGASATTETVPYMYYMMNRDGSDTSGVNIAQLRNAGARPVAFKKKIVISYKPNLIKANSLIVTLTPNTSLYNGNNTPVYDQWISTSGLQHPGSPSWAGQVTDLPIAAQGTIVNPLVPPDMVNVLPYYGHGFYFDQAVSPVGATAVGFLTITCIWEFKEPVLYGAGSDVNQPVVTI